MQDVDSLILSLRSASTAERETIKANLIARCKEADGNAVRERIDQARKGELLEVQWELEEVLDATAPPKPETPKAPEAAKPPEAPPDPNRPLTSKDLTLVYDDPRGLMLHKAKVGDRWFATQFDQRTGQPQTFELQAQEIAQLKVQLAGSPYWVIGSGVVPAAPPKSPLAGKPPGAR